MKTKAIFILCIGLLLAGCGGSKQNESLQTAVTGAYFSAQMPAEAAKAEETVGDLSSLGVEDITLTSYLCKDGDEAYLVLEQNWAALIELTKKGDPTGQQKQHISSLVTQTYASTDIQLTPASVGNAKGLTAKGGNVATFSNGLLSEYTDGQSEAVLVPTDQSVCIIVYAAKQGAFNQSNCEAFMDSFKSTDTTTDYISASLFSTAAE